MHKINGVTNNPSLKNKFAFIKQLEANNKKQQEAIWQKFSQSTSKPKDVAYQNIGKSKFQSHPSLLSTTTESSLYSSESSSLENLHVVSQSATSLNAKKPIKKKPSKPQPQRLDRKQLHARLTKHLEEGTLDKFEVTPIGDWLPRSTCKKKAETKTSTIYTSSSTSIIDMMEPTEKYVRSANINLHQNERVNGMKKKTDSDVTTATKIIKKPVFKISASQKKIRNFIEKSVGIIKDIGLILGTGIVPPDGSEDLSRRHKRSKEFCSRLSRTYLYPLVTHINDIQAMDAEKKFSYSPKFISAYQIVFQGLQSCFNHFPITVGTTSYQKLKELLGYTAALCEKNVQCIERENNFDNEDYVNILQTHCKDLMQHLNDNFLCVSMDSILKSKCTEVSLTSQSKVGKTNKPNLHKRLSMYNGTAAFRRERHYQKAVDASDKKQHAFSNVKSRYKTATFKHRPRIEKPQMEPLIPLIQANKYFEKGSTNLLLNTPVPTPYDEDSIRTMVQIDQEKEDKSKENGTRTKLNMQESGIKPASNHEDILMKLLQLVQNNDVNEKLDADSSLPNLSKTIMVLQECLSIKQKNTHVMQKLLEENPQPEPDNNVAARLGGGCDKKQRKEPVITVCGPKNAQLICIKDENSTITSYTSDIDEKASPSLLSPRQTFTSEIKMDPFDRISCNMESKNELRDSKSNIKICRLSKATRHLKLLPKCYAIHIIQYKLEFHKYCKGDHMYRRTTTVQPWELIGKLSDEIMDYALLGIAREIEVNEMLENMYNAEFQY